jgi:hypothetical protein
MASSRSVGSWRSLRLPTTRPRAARRAAGSSPRGRWGASPASTRTTTGVRGPQDVAPAAPGGDPGGPLHGRSADAPAGPGRPGSGPAPANHRPGRCRVPAGRSGGPALRGWRPQPAWVAEGRGAPSKTSSWPPSRWYTGSTPLASSSPSAASHQQSSKPPTTVAPAPDRGAHPIDRASTKPGAVHIVIPPPGQCAVALGQDASRWSGGCRPLCF